MTAPTDTRDPLDVLRDRLQAALPGWVVVVDRESKVQGRAAADGIRGTATLTVDGHGAGRVLQARVWRAEGGAWRGPMRPYSDVDGVVVDVLAALGVAL